ncbi:MAG TPA: hypothetical protein VF761_16810 [Gemmatimonadaceae bacterium]
MEPTTTTITEALAEVKLIGKKIGKKQEFILTYLLRGAMVKDPLEKDGGSETIVAREMQAIRDLEERVVKIRTAIAHANATAQLTIGTTTRTVSEWLTWRRDVAPIEKKLLGDIVARVNAAREQARRATGKLTSDAAAAEPSDILVNLSEVEIQTRVEAIEEVLGRLDGLLSLHNARTTITLN